MNRLRKLFLKIRKKVIIGILVFIMGFGLFSAARPAIDEFLLPFGRTPFVLVLRDLAIATYAHIKAGDEIPYEVILDYEAIDWDVLDYRRGTVVPAGLTWDIETNSLWIADQIRRIVPFFYYEDVREDPQYPKTVVMVPYPSQKSFHILGDANHERSIIRLNERFFLETGRRDLRQVYSTLVHELVHIQGGGFSWTWLANANLQSNLESRTQVATIEVLAGMCHYQDKIACKTFWSEIEGYARGSLMMRLRIYGYEAWYDKIANLLWRDTNDQLQRNKSLRYWMNDPTLRNYYYEIIDKYQKRPWEDLIVRSICEGTGLRTGFLVETEDSKNSQTRKNPIYVSLVMQLDDTINMFGEEVVNFICSMPYGSGVH